MKNVEQVVGELPPQYPMYMNLKPEKYSWLEWMQMGGRCGYIRSR